MSRQDEMDKMKKMQPTPRLPLTDECRHYDDIRSVPWDLQKYWHQRYSLFAGYDDGICLTDDAWFGVTPEPVARQIAEEMASSKFAGATALVDLFAGAGGNVIAFALSERWERLVAVERDADVLACAQHNAEACGVEDGAVTWVLGDCFDYLALLKSPDPHALLDPALRLPLATTTLFASPPWGGVGYRDHDVFDLAAMRPYSLLDLHDACMPMGHALYLPRTSDVRQVAALAPADDKIDVVQYCMEGASKAMVAYIPGTASTRWNPPGHQHHHKRHAQDMNDEDGEHLDY